MRGFIVLATFGLGLLSASCAPSSGASTEITTTQCETPESGIIRAPSPGLEEIKLTGPIMVTMLAPVIDPANPHPFIVYWSNGNVGFLTSDLKGPFYLASGETLSGVQEHMPSPVVYSGCRIEE
ncbi:MAG: hypothetical protein ABWZ40_12025 [Caulobacterales bacterium]